jgi:hypothetical protein
MSQNSADSSTGNNSKNIPKVVSDHADRLMDGLFADIEELLSGDLSKQHKSQPAAIAAAPPHRPVKNPNLQPVTAGGMAEYPQPPVAAAAPIANSASPPSGTWKKILIGLGLMAAVAGGGIWWLAKENRINFHWLTKPDVASDASKSDIQFADYLRRALGKIDGNSTPSPAANQVTIPNPPTALVATAPAIRLEPPIVPATVITPSAVVTVPEVSADSSFNKVLTGNPPRAEFIIEGKTQQLAAGDKIGKSGWVLTPVISALDNEVIIKRNGELRTLKAGQPFKF